MGSSLSLSNVSEEDREMALTKVKTIATSAPVVVFSKSYCGYSYRVRQLLTSLGASFHVIELDEENDGYKMQSALTQWTGLRTIPNVFIGGKHVGGCDALQHKYRKGELLPLLNEAGAVANKPA